MILLQRLAWSTMVSRSSLVWDVVFALLEHEVGVEEKGAERVVDLVCDPGGKLTHARQLGGSLQRVLGLLRMSGAIPPTPPYASRSCSMVYGRHMSESARPS